jgi:hypothetical protein
VEMCRPLLQLIDDRVFFAHLTAKEYLGLKYSSFSSIRDFFTRSLEAKSMSQLDREDSGPSQQVRSWNTKAPDSETLAGMRYPSVHWIDHFCEALGVPFGSGISPDALDLVGRFLRTTFSYWIEILSFFQCMGDAIRTMEILENLSMVSHWLELKKKKKKGTRLIDLETIIRPPTIQSHSSLISVCC